MGDAVQAVIAKLLEATKDQKNSKNLITDLDYLNIHVLCRLANNPANLQKLYNFIASPDHHRCDNITSMVQFYPFDPMIFKELLMKFTKDKKHHPKKQQILIVQGTSMPHQNKSMESFSKILGCVSSQQLEKITALVDMCYNPSSNLLSRWDFFDVNFIDGLDMLIHQALLSEQIWWNQHSPFEYIKKNIDTF